MRDDFWVLLLMLAGLVWVHVSFFKGMRGRGREPWDGDGEEGS